MNTAREVMEQLLAIKNGGEIADKVKEIIATMDDNQLALWRDITQLFYVASKTELVRRGHK